MHEERKANGGAGGGGEDLGHDGGVEWEDLRALYHLLMGADFLDADELIDLLIGKVVSMVRCGHEGRGNSTDVLLKNDFAPEQEAKICQEECLGVQIEFRVGLFQHCFIFEKKR